jgi:putative flippase GtrA
MLPFMKQFVMLHYRKFALYMISGFGAAIADLGSYFLLLHFDVWYIAASIVSGIFGFATAFLLHKYIVFQKNDEFMKHLLRYFIVDMINLGIITLILYGLVEHIGIDAGIAKFAALAPVVLWNFFIYKFFVYV